jgi:hypothetical protein
MFYLDLKKRTIKGEISFTEDGNTKESFQADVESGTDNEMNGQKQ